VTGPAGPTAELALPPMLTLLSRGIALEAHGQNTLVVLRDGRPVRVLYGLLREVWRFLSSALQSRWACHASPVSTVVATNDKGRNAGRPLPPRHRRRRRQARPLALPALRIHP
jgi:hypothetical protein